MAEQHWTGGAPLTTAAAAQAAPGIVVREYKGKLADATRQFQADAARMAETGYYPVSQNYQPGSWGAGAFIVAVLLFLILIGIFVFIYMLLVKPAGTLVVTYQWRAA